MAFIPNRNYRPRKPDHGYKINENIQSPQVRIVGDGITSMECSIREALEIAKSMGLDLVEINPSATPPLAKVCDFPKFLYEKKKKEKEMKNQNKTTTKEIQLGPNIGDHDLNHKVKKGIEFLAEGHKIKASIRFKGRQLAHKDLGQIVMLKFVQALEEHGKPEMMRVRGSNEMSPISTSEDGRSMHVSISPKK